MGSTLYSTSQTARGCLFRRLVRRLNCCAKAAFSQPGLQVRRARKPRVQMLEQICGKRDNSLRSNELRRLIDRLSTYMLRMSPPFYILFGGVLARLRSLCFPKFYVGLA